jgi:HAE1 family hydrophobic/amphiphilic exporter-1
VVRRRGNELVRLSQVATVRDGFAEQAGQFSLRNGHPNVGLSVTRTREASTVSVADEIRKPVAARDRQGAARGHALEVTQDGGEDARTACATSSRRWSSAPG